VRVPTGAFVARRNGHMFITGNSGWPKATKIDTQVDKAAGAEREVIEQGPYAARRPQADHTRQGTIHADDSYVRPAGDPRTAPATPLAALWEQHRYGLQALRPAVEPILIWQKPYQHAAVEDITRTGAGALWIEGCRVAGPAPHHNYGRTSGPESMAGASAVPFNTPSAGRWPSNVSLIHTPACRPAGVTTLPGDPRGACAGQRPGGFGNVGAATGSPEPNAPVYGNEVVQRWACSPDCPVAALEAQAGEHPTGALREGSLSTLGWHPGLNVTRSHGYEASTGLVSRFFPQFGWADDIAERLALADPLHYCAKASQKERGLGLTQQNPGTVVQLRADLTEEQRKWVLAELDRLEVRPRR
jgi:hypothetical protein